MVTSRFQTKQPELRTYPEDNRTRYMICENGKQYTDIDFEGNKTAGWEYDFTEFAEYNDILSADKIKADPKAYVDYIPVKSRPKNPAKPTTLEQRITDIEDILADVIGGEAE